jgi:hypothetical protein
MNESVIVLPLRIYAMQMKKLRIVSTSSHLLFRRGAARAVTARRIFLSKSNLAPEAKTRRLGAKSKIPPAGAAGMIRNMHIAPVTCRRRNYICKRCNFNRDVTHL